MDIFSFVRLFGGLGLLLFGMTLMGGALEKVAGERLERTLERMTKNILGGMLLGAAVTGVIQSSAATTIMVIGFVSAGIMTLKQAAGIIMGANIGTTVTAQLLRLDSGGAVSGSTLLALIKPANLAYIVVLVGTFIIFLAKKKRTRDIGEIFLGFGILFIGMNTMEASVSGLSQSELFRSIFSSLENPILGVIAGILVTAVVQSSSVTVGILQALATTGAVSWGAAVPIILGQNIGSCVTALIASVGSGKSAKRTALIHVYFNTIGSLIFLTVLYIVRFTGGAELLASPISKGGIANFHTVFNVISTAIFLPAAGILVKLAEMTIPVTEKSKREPISLDEHFYQTPAIALDQCRKLIGEMGYRSAANFKSAMSKITDGASVDMDEFNANEDFIDRAQVKASQYLLGLNLNELSASLIQRYNEMMHSMGEFERIGDYAENIMEQSQEMFERDIAMSEKALSELRVIGSATNEVLDLLMEAYISEDPNDAGRIEPLEQVIDLLKETLKDRHLSRLQSGECTINTGVSFLEIVHNCEKISDHCSTIAVYLIEASHSNNSFDSREYIEIVHAGQSADYSESYLSYKNRYMSMI